MSDVGLSTPEPGGMVAQLQRRRLKGDSALSTFQGMRFDEIVILRANAEAIDASAFVAAVNAYAVLMMREFHFLPGEFAQEAAYSYHATDYVAAALAGGHAAYWANRRDDPVAIHCASFGLKGMLADPYHEVISTFTRLMSLDQKSLQRLLKQKRWRNVAAGLRALDEKLSDLAATEPLAPRQRTWLKSLRKIRLVEPHEMDAYRSAFETANPLRARRALESAKVRAEREQIDPTYRSVRALTDMAGLQFVELNDGRAAPMREVWPEGPERPAFIRPVVTDRGQRAAVFYRERVLFKRYLAVLLEQGAALPSGSLTLDRETYETIVPPYARRPRR